MNATFSTLEADSTRVRQASAYVAFGLLYFILAAYAASLPLHERLPMFIWPAHGLALGTLLVAPVRRWGVYLALVLLSTVVVGMYMGAPWQSIAATSAVNAAQPLFVAAGLLRLAGPRVQIDSVKNLASFLVGMVPLVAAMAILDGAYSYFSWHSTFKEQWSVAFFSTFLGMVLTSPLILA